MVFVAFTIVITYHHVQADDDKYFQDMMARIDKMLAEMTERQRIAEEKRKNLQFKNEDLFNVSHQIDLLGDLNYRQREELKILQLIGN